MDQKSLPPIWVFIGAGVVVVAAFGFLLSSLVMGGTRAPEVATPLPLATQVMPTRTEPAAEAPAATQIPTLTPPTEVEAPIPTLAPAQVPESAPDFTLKQAKGEPVTLSEQLAKGPVVLVLMQSGGGWRPNPQLGELQTHLATIRAAGAEVIVVVSASIEQVQGWCQVANVDYPMLADPGQTVSKAYGVHNLLGAGSTMPSAFIIDTESNIVWYTVGQHAADYVRAQAILDNLP